MNIPELSNNYTLLIELIAGISIAIGISLYFHRKQEALTKNQDSILNEVKGLVTKINDLTLQQSELIAIMESRRRSRIGWFKGHSLKVLDSVKRQYSKLSDAVEKYNLEENDENLKAIQVISSGALKMPVRNAIDLIVNRDLPIAAEYIESTWIIAKLPDVLSLIGQGFATAEQSPTDIENIRENIKLSLENLDWAIGEISNERN